MSYKPKLYQTIDEPRVSGTVLRIELYNDWQAAVERVGDARKVLGAVRTQTILNEDIAQQRHLGFVHRWFTLADGTQVHALSNGGLDTLRIYPPVYGGTSSKKARSPEEEEETIKPYLWIGLRPTQQLMVADTPLSYAGSVCGLLIEPDGVHTLLGEAGILYKRYAYAGAFGALSDPNSFDGAALATYRNMDNSDPVQGGLFDTEAAFVQPVGFEPLAVNYDPEGGACFSTGGVIGYDILANYYANNSDNYSTVASLIPVDPKVPMLDAVYPEGQLGGFTDTVYGDAYWHNVFLLDPHPDLIDPLHEGLREMDGQLRDVVETALGTHYDTSIGTKSGVYILKIAMFGYCRNSAISGPVDIQVEVRLGKPEQEVFQTTVTIDWWSRWPKPMLPGGSRSSSIGSPDDSYGAGNPHGPMWWQGALEIDVESHSVKQLAYWAEAPFFAQAGYNRAIDSCDSSWYPWMLASFYPGTVPIGDTLEANAYHFARTWYANTWYLGEQGHNMATIDWSIYNIAALTSQIIAYAGSAGFTSLDGTKITASGQPGTQGTRNDPAIAITEMSRTSSTEWTNLVYGGQLYNGVYHHMRAVF